MRALFAGTFDPPTWGHLNLMERASLLFGKLFVAVAINSQKKPLLTDEERMAFLRQFAKKHHNIEVVEIKGLTVDFARQNEIDILVRGVRNPSDFDFEFQMASTNKRLTGIETFFLPADPAFTGISSTLIREIAAGGHSLKEFVPPEIEYLLKKHSEITQ